MVATTARATHGTFERSTDSQVVSRWLLPEECDAFAVRYARALGVRAMSLDGMQELRGFWQRGALVAGYRLGRTASRYAALVGPEASARWPFEPAQAAEISHLWMSPLLDAADRRAVYAHMLTDLLATGQRYIVGGTVSPLIRQSQMASLPWLLDDWVVEGLLEVPTRAWVYYGTPITLVRNAIRMGVPVPWLGLLR